MSNIMFNKPPMSPLLARVLREMEALGREPGGIEKFMASEEFKLTEIEMRNRLRTFGSCFPDCE